MADEAKEKVQDTAGQRKPPAPGTAPTGQGGRALADQYLQRGLNHYDRQEIEEALAAYQQCVQADPTFGLGHNNLGMVLIDLGRHEEAVAELQEAIRCDPTHAEAYNNLGFVLRRMQRLPEAAAAYTRFLELEPDVEEAPRIRMWLSSISPQAAVSAGRPSAPAVPLPPAPAAATAPPTAPPPPPPAPSAPTSPLPPPPPPPAPLPPAPLGPQPEAAPAPGRGSAVELPKIKKLSGWEISMEPGGAPAQPSSAAETVPATAAELPKIKKSSTMQMYAEERQTPAPAVPAAEAAQAPPQPEAAPVEASAPIPAPVPAEPQTAIELVERGMDQFAEGNLTEAGEVFQKAIDMEPENAEGYTGLAKVLIRQEKLDEAIELLQKAVQLDPADPAAYYVLGFALRAVERNVEAAEAYEHFLELLPQASDSEKMREWIIHIQRIAGRTAGGDEEVVVDDEQIVTELDRKYKNALGRLQEGDADTALHDCLRILQEDPRHIRTRVLLGRAYLRQKAYDKAIEQFENALLTRSDYPEALYFLGQASEKKGLIERAAANYERYMEVAPGGPRAERLRDWLLSQGAPAAVSADGKQAQCELCLRFFPETELTQHEGRATCRNCLAVMGGTSTLNVAAPTSTATAVTAPATAAAAAPQPVRSRSGLVLLGVLFVLAATGAWLYFTHRLDRLLYSLPFVERPKPPEPPKPPNPPKPPFNPKDVKIVNEPESLVVRPFVPWSYKPELQGHEVLNQLSPGWGKEFKLKDAPPGMALDAATGVLSWLPAFTDFEALKKGQVFNVEFAVKGVGSEPGGESKEWFTVQKAFTLTCQFGYEWVILDKLGPEQLEAGLLPTDQPALAAGDFNGDELVDTIICSGRFRSGAVRLYLGKKGTPLPQGAMELDKGTRFSALYAGCLDGVKNGDLLVADWQRGRIKVFFRGKQSLAPGAEVTETAVGPGPVALGVGSMEKDKPPAIAVYSGIPGQLAITSLPPAPGPGRKFGPVINVPIPGGGNTAFIFPWVSAELGSGFLTIVPLAPSPIVFVPYNDGKWERGGKAVVSSGLEMEGYVAAAAVQDSSKGKRRLALVVTGKESNLVTLEEKAGKFEPSGKPESLPSLGLGLLAQDFNQDGQDDLFVVMLDQCAFYFAQGSALYHGPRILCDTRMPRMLGPVVKFAIGPVDRPDLLLLNANRKAQILQSVAPPPQPVAEEKKQ